MLLLNEQEKDAFLKITRSSDCDIIRAYINKVIKDVTDVDNLSTDAIKNAQNTKHILKTHLLDILEEKDVEPLEEDSYE